MLCAKSLLDDRRGAIMVMGVFMATFLVGCLWYLIGIGETAVYREKVQAAADAAAFASAVYHARGMNLVALLNVVMICILAVLIALHIVQLVVGAIAIAAAIICAIPMVGTWACPIAAGASNVWSRLNPVIDKVQRIADRVLPALSKTQDKIALISPWVGAVRAEVVALQYGHPVQAGIAMSVSMVPSKAIMSVTRNKVVDEAQRLGLPLRADQDDGCKYAGQMLGDWAFGWIPWTTFLGNMIGTLGSAFPQYFCGSGNNLFFAGQRDSRKSCMESEKKWDPKLNGDKEFDFDGCMEGFRAAEKDPGKVSQNNKKNGIKDVDPNKKPAKFDRTDWSFKQLYFGVKNGDDYFQVYGFVKADTGMTKRSGKGVAIPSWGKANPRDGSLMDDAIESIGFAEAEFYYDQPGEWDEAAEVAIVNMKWRARLRRFRLPSPRIATNVILNGIPSWVPVPAKFKNKGLTAFNDLVTRYLGDNSVTCTLIYDMLAEKLFAYGDKIDGPLDKFIGERSESKVIH